MVRPLAILMVEDSDDDAALMRHALRRGGLQATSERVDSASGLRAAWARAAWDVVLCDYGLPGFSLEEALAITRKHDGTIPFIAVSGSIGEEAVAALMRAGVSDVVLKSSLASRLASVVKRELAAGKNSAQLSASEAQLREIAANIPGLVYRRVLRPDGSIIYPYVAGKILDSLAITPEEVSEGRFQLLRRVDPEDVPRFMGAIKRSARDLSPIQVDYRFVLASGERRWMSVHSRPLREADGSVVWDVVAVDVTDRKRDAAALRDASAVVANTDRGVFTTSLEGIITSINAAFSASTGYAEVEALGHHIRLLQSSRHDPEFFATQKRSLEETGSWQNEIWLKRKNDELFPAFLTMNAVRDESKQPVNYVGTFTDISRAKEQERKLEQLANSDALTGLPNRVVFVIRLGHALDRMRRSGKTGAVLFLDLDRFQSINESLGHPTGDDVLRVLGGRLQTQLRDGDMVARLGGDEFAILLEDLADAGTAAQVADSLLQKVLEPIPLSGGQEIVIGASIGISLFPADGVEVHELMRHADAALYQAKADGRGIYRFSTPELTRGAADRFDLEGRLRRGIERHEFVLHYQPLVSLADRSLKGVEALVR
jgi:diguanylate cyclase (GGDEF)-like protein/PAS domain S-box-containing protein